MHCLLTGARGGIGTAIHTRLHADGWTVIAIDQEELDLKDKQAVDNYITELYASGIQLDALVSAAGILPQGDDLDSWEEIFAINARSPYQLARLVGEKMAAHGGGSIVTIASNSAVIPRAKMAAYGASKAAASIATRSLGLELGPHGVRCNVVCPGTTQTQMISHMGDPRRIIAGIPEDFKAGIPLGRIAQPEDIAGVVSFLLGPDSRHINCAEIVVDGGASA